MPAAAFASLPLAKIAEAARCAPSTVAEAIKALEADDR
jgi:hypothetical protein